MYGVFFISSFTYSLSQCFCLKQMFVTILGVCVWEKVEPGSGIWTQMVWDKKPSIMSMNEQECLQNSIDF